MSAYEKVKRRAEQALAAIRSRPRELRSVEDFAAIVVGDQFGGVGDQRTVAQWQNDRREYVRHYKGGVALAVRVIADTLAGLELRPMFRRIDKSGVILEPLPHNHALIELFAEINEDHTTFDWIWLMVAFRLVTGSSYSWKDRNGLGVPKHLWILPSTWVWAIPSQRTFIEGYRVRSVAGKNWDIPAKDMIDIRSPNIDWSGSGRFYGWPIPRSNAAAVDSEAAMWDRLVWHFKNFSPPGLHYKTDQPLNRIQLKQAVGDILSQHRLAEHSGRPIFSHSGFEATEFRNSIREMDYAKSLDFTIELELATFGVPKALVGMIESFNRANLVAAQAAACEHTIAPIQSHMMQHLTQNLGREFDERIVIVQEECRPNDPEQKRKNVETLLKFHTITANEAREVLAEGLVGPLKRGGDTILGPIQLGELPRGNEEITNEPEEEPRNEEPNDDASEDRSLSVGGNGRAGGIDGPVLGCVSCGDDERHKFILDKAREVQSVVFAKDNWSVSRARGWLRSHGFKAPQPDITPNTYRFRQFPPSQCSGGFATLTENMPKGVSMVACERRERRGGDNDRTVSVWHGERLRGRHSLSDQRITGNSFSCGRTAVLGAEGTATDTAIQKEQEREQEFGVILEKETEASASGRNPEDSKAAFVQMWLKQHGRIEERFADVIVRFLRGQKRRVLTRLNELGMAKPGDETKLLPAGEEDRGLMEVANQQIEQAMAIGASLELEREPTRAMHFMETKPRVGRVDIPEDVFQAIRQSIGETFGVRYWQENFSNHTRNKIRRVLKVSVEEGQSVAQLAKTIRNDSPQLFSRTRAFTVARTESTGALNGGQSIVQDQLMADGVIDARSWQATLDAATRSTHLAADGQIRKAGELFDVGSERARFPGDPNLSAGERVHCRCVPVSEVL